MLVCRNYGAKPHAKSTNRVDTHVECPSTFEGFGCRSPTLLFRRGHPEIELAAVALNFADGPRLKESMDVHITTKVVFTVDRKHRDTRVQFVTHPHLYASMCVAASASAPSIIKIDLIIRDYASERERARAKERETVCVCRSIPIPVCFFKTRTQVHTHIHIHRYT